MVELTINQPGVHKLNGVVSDQIHDIYEGHLYFPTEPKMLVY